jgi:hypothetical protein
LKGKIVKESPKMEKNQEVGTSQAKQGAGEQKVAETSQVKSCDVFQGCGLNIGTPGPDKREEAGERLSIEVIATLVYDNSREVQSPALGIREARYHLRAELVDGRGMERDIIVRLATDGKEPEELNALVQMEVEKDMVALLNNAMRQ